MCPLADLFIFIMRSYLKAQLTVVDFKQFGPFYQTYCSGGRSEVLDVHCKADIEGIRQDNSINAGCKTDQ